MLCLLLAAVAAPVIALDAGNQDAQPSPTADPAAKPQAPTAEPADATPQAGEKTPPADAAGPIREFIPTEKIEADSAVSFPVDI